MTVETDLQEIVGEWYLKEIKDLSSDEKAKIVKELTVYSLSDSYAELDKELRDSANGMEKSIKEEVEDFGRDRTLTYSQLDRDYLTKDFMESVIEDIDDTIGGKVFKASLQINIKNFEKTILERIEPGYDAPTFTELDIQKHNRLLQLSVKNWLSQTIVAYEKTTEAPEEKGAY